MNDTPIEINKDINPVASVIWLHGLGADGNDFVPVIEMLDLPTIRFILPHAPYRPVTINNGAEMRAWYDLYGLTSSAPQDEAGIYETQQHIERLIEKEITSGIPSHKIILAGFSQGGAIALHTALRFKQKLAGIIALSTYLPMRTTLTAEQASENFKTPIFMAHGTHDEVISLATARASLEALTINNYNVSWHEYPIEHSVSLDEIDEIRTFLLNIIK